MCYYTKQLEETNHQVGSFRDRTQERDSGWEQRHYLKSRGRCLLVREPASIAQIGGRVGYDSAGKFTVAFKKVMKLTPSEYRRERGMNHEA